MCNQCASIAAPVCLRLELVAVGSVRANPPSTGNVSNQLRSHEGAGRGSLPM